jgi:hypothetical protein
MHTTKAGKKHFVQLSLETVIKSMNLRTIFPTIYFATLMDVLVTVRGEEFWPPFVPAKLGCSMVWLKLLCGDMYAPIML